MLYFSLVKNLSILLYGGDRGDGTAHGIGWATGLLARSWTLQAVHRYASFEFISRRTVSRVVLRCMSCTSPAPLSYPTDCTSVGICDNASTAAGAIITPHIYSNLQASKLSDICHVLCSKALHFSARYNTVLLGMVRSSTAPYRAWSDSYSYMKVQQYTATNSLALFDQLVYIQEFRRQPRSVDY